MAPMFPLLAGQNATYLSAQLRAFRDGSRNGTIMNAMARDLGNAQIDALANYYSTLGEPRSEEHTSELQSLMRISYAVFCFKKKKIKVNYITIYPKKSNTNNILN